MKWYNNSVWGTNIEYERCTSVKKVMLLENWYLDQARKFRDSYGSRGN